MRRRFGAASMVGGLRRPWVPAWQGCSSGPEALCSGRLRYSVAGRESRGKLQRRPVRSVLAPQQLIGKEGNKLLERQVGEVVHSDEYLADYGARKDAWHFVVAAVRQLGAGAVARRSGLDRRTIQRAVRKHPDPTTPHRANQTRITIAAAAEARARLAELGEAPPDGALPALVRYLEVLNAALAAAICVTVRVGIDGRRVARMRAGPPRL